MLTEGDGTARFFHGYDNLGNYTSPEGDFTRLMYTSASGGSPAYYRRVYPDGTQVFFHPDGRMNYTADRFGNVSRVQYQSASSPVVLFLTDPTNKSLYFSYDAAGKLRWIENPGGDGRDTYFTVNGAGDLTTVQAADGSYPIRATYHTSHALDLWLDASGAEWDVGNNEHGELARVVAPSVVTTDAGTTRPITDVVGPMSAVLPDQDGPCGYTVGSGSCPAPWLAPDSARLQTKDPRGNITSIRVDRYGLPIRIDDPVGRTAFTERNEHGQVTRERSNAANGLTRRYNWAGVELRKTIDSVGTQLAREVNYEYEPAFHQPTRVTGTGLPETLYEYDAADPQRKLLRTRVGSPYETPTTYTYTTRGRIATVTDPEGHQSSVTYEASGAQNTATMTSTPPKAGVPTTTSVRYDAAGRQVAVFAPSGDSVKVQYDLLNRVTHSINGAGDTTVTEYDARGVRKVTDARGLAYTFERNALAWVLREVAPNGSARSYGYDRVGNLTSSTNRRGQTVTFEHDVLGRVLKRTADGAATDYAYDSNLTDTLEWVSATNAEGTDTIFSHVDGRKLRQASVLGGRRFSIVSGYLNNSQRTRVELVAPFPRTITYGYDDIHHDLSGIKDSGGAWMTMYRNHDRQVYRETLPNAVVRDITYAANHGVTAIKYPGGSSAPLGERFGYDGMGRMTVRSDTAERVRRQFFYDDAGQVQTEVAEEMRRVCQNIKDPSTCADDWVEVASKTFSYTYDRVGNRTDYGVNTDSVSNRLMTFDGYTMTYDADGNMTRKLKAGVDSLSMTWNSLGQMTSATRRGQGTVTYGYNGFGQRVRRTAPNGVVMRYLYEGDDLFMELDAAGNPVREYTYYPGVDQPHSVRSGTAVHYYATDPNGNVTGLIDSTGGISARYEYTAWGEPTLWTGTLDQPLRYMAREYDAVTGLYYVRARWYDPGARRFNSEDPIGLAGGINTYTYANNDPVNLRDPFGLFAAANCTYKWRAPVIGHIGGSHVGGGFDVSGFGRWEYVCEAGGGSPDPRECTRGADGMCRLYVPKDRWGDLGDRISRIDGPGEACAGARQILMEMWSEGPKAQRLRFWGGIDMNREFVNNDWTGRYLRNSRGEIVTTRGDAAPWPAFIAFEATGAMNSAVILPHEGLHAWFRDKPHLDGSETRIREMQKTCRVR